MPICIGFDVCIWKLDFGDVSYCPPKKDFDGDCFAAWDTCYQEDHDTCIFAVDICLTDQGSCHIYDYCDHDRAPCWASDSCGLDQAGDCVIDDVCGHSDKLSCGFKSVDYCQMDVDPWDPCPWDIWNPHCSLDRSSPECPGDFGGGHKDEKNGPNLCYFD